jgi:hypothetical protein
MFGSQNTATPLRYHLNYRQFFIVKSGKIHVKMTPMKSKKYLKPIKDYDNYEFRSPINVWNPQPEYLHEMDKLKFLEFDVLAGYVLYVPPYWWYSIQYLDDPNTFVCGISYNTMMNCVSNIWDLTIYWLQQQNITKKITKIPSPIVEVPPLSSPPVQQSQLSPTSPLVDNTQTQTQTQTQPISAEMLQIPVTNVSQIPIELVQPPTLETKPVEVSNSVLPPPPPPENVIVQDTTVVQETVAVHEKAEDPVSTVIPENVTTSLSL